MKNLWQIIELGVPLGIGTYIGFEIIKALSEMLSKCFIWVINKAIGDDEKWT